MPRRRPGRRTRRDSAPTREKRRFRGEGGRTREPLSGPGPRPGGGSNRLTSRSSVGRCLRKCHWPGYPLASHVIAAERFRSPSDSADAFTVLVERGICPPEMEDALRAMARFRNRLVHVYWHIDDTLVAEYVQSRLTDFDRFTACVARLLRPLESRRPGRDVAELDLRRDAGRVLPAGAGERRHERGGRGDGRELCLPPAGLPAAESLRVLRLGGRLGAPCRTSSSMPQT
jgi:hypothetical protein